MGDGGGVSSRTYERMNSEECQCGCGDPLTGRTLGRRQGGMEVLKSRGPVAQEKLSPRRWARLESESKRGPLAHGFAGD